MSSSRRPWFKWYPKDFNADEKVKCLPPLAELIYRRALDLMWQSNSIRIPNAMPLLYQSLGSGIESHDFDAAWERIQYPDFELFKTTEDKKWLFSERLRREAEEIENIVNSRINAGKAGAKARWKSNNGKGNGKRIANAWQKDGNTDTDTDTDNKKKNILKRKVQIPQDFKITPPMQSWFKKQDFKIKPEYETEKFIDHFQAKGEAKKDWVAAWRNWMRKANEYCKDDRSDWI
jgi:hypothetical protein